VVLVGCAITSIHHLPLVQCQMLRSLKRTKKTRQPKTKSVPSLKQKKTHGLKSKIKSFENGIRGRKRKPNQTGNPDIFSTIRGGVIGDDESYPQSDSPSSIPSMSMDPTMSNSPSHTPSLSSRPSLSFAPSNTPSISLKPSQFPTEPPSGSAVPSSPPSISRVPSRFSTMPSGSSSYTPSDIPSNGSTDSRSELPFVMDPEGNIVETETDFYFVHPNQ
jgi:hypothetical protein